MRRCFPSSTAKGLAAHLSPLGGASQEGWAISYVSENPHGEERYVRMLQQRASPSIAASTPEDKLFRLGHFDLAIFAFWYVAEGRQAHPQHLAQHEDIVDVIDLHWLRHVREHFVRPRTEPEAHDQIGVRDVRELNVYGKPMPCSPSPTRRPR